MTGVMDSGTCPVPLDSSIHRGACHPEFHAFGYNRLVQRLALPLVAFSEMNP
jgi:hypothetical protein